MNFKVFPFKIILSMIIGIICGFSLTNKYYEPTGLIDVVGPILILFFSLISAAVVYIIWSLIQKK